MSYRLRCGPEVSEVELRGELNLPRSSVAGVLRVLFAEALAGDAGAARCTYTAGVDSDGVGVVVHDGLGVVAVATVCSRHDGVGAQVVAAVVDVVPDVEAFEAKLQIAAGMSLAEVDDLEERNIPVLGSGVADIVLGPRMLEADVLRNDKRAGVEGRGADLTARIGAQIEV